MEQSQISREKYIQSMNIIGFATAAIFLMPTPKAFGDGIVFGLIQFLFFALNIIVAMRYNRETKENPKDFKITNYDLATIAGAIFSIVLFAVVS